MSSAALASDSETRGLGPLRSLRNAGNACVMLATPVELELAGPQSLLPLVLVGDQPMMHPEQLASEDDQC